MKHDTFDVAAAKAINAPQRYEAIAVMGPTGSGKSTFISKLARDQVTVGHDLTSCTERIAEYLCDVDGRQVMLIDTPGFNDTNQQLRNDTVILEDLMAFMKDSWDNDMLLSGIIYLHPLTDARMTGSSITNLSMFRKLCGDRKLENVVLTTTKWDDNSPEVSSRRQGELESPDGFWGLYIASGSRVRRFMNTQESAREIVSEILGFERFLPQIQEEAIKGATVKQTEAGAFLNKALDDLRALHARETAALRGEIARANSENDLKLRAALEVQQKRVDAEVANVLKEQQRLNETKVEKLERRIRELEKTHPNNYPSNAMRTWHTRWRCMACEEEKTGVVGIWECPGCKVKQNNVY